MRALGSKTIQFRESSTMRGHCPAGPAAPGMAAPPLRILFDLKHPAHYHFFRHVMAALRRDGHSLTITCRKSPTLISLLDAGGLPYQIVSTKGKGILGLARELLLRDWALYRIARKVRPDVLVAKHGLCISHVGTILRIPSLSYEDTEHAKLQIRLSWPFLTRILTDHSYLIDAGKKHRRLNLLNALAYLHPHHFAPNPTILHEVGLSRDEPYVVVRFVAWDAAHDIPARRSRDAQRRRLVAELAKHARVLVVPEKTLPADLEQHVPKFPPHRFHDLLAFAAAHVGEGGSVAAEAAVLGVPTVYTNPLGGGCLDELIGRGLCRWETDPEKALSVAKEWLKRPTQIRALFEQKRKRLLLEKGDPVRLLAEQVVLLGREGRTSARRKNSAHATAAGGGSSSSISPGTDGF